jgi:D-cysteine desulfhydrase
VADAQAQGCDTLVTYGGPQSNHCRAAAAVGARLGMKVHIIIRGNKPEGAPDGNLLLNFMLGAEVTYARPIHSCKTNKKSSTA